MAKKKLQDLFKELKFEQNKINEVIMYMSEKTCNAFDGELKSFGIDKKFFIMSRNLVIQTHILLGLYAFTR